MDKVYVIIQNMWGIADSFVQEESFKTEEEAIQYIHDNKNIKEVKENQGSNYCFSTNTFFYNLDQEIYYEILELNLN